MGGKPRASGRDDSEPRLFQRIMEVVQAGVVHVGADGNILNANAQAARLLGLSYDELTKRYTQDFEGETILEDGSPCPMTEYPVTKALMTGLPQGPKTIGVRTQEGKLRWATFSAAPIKDRSGRVHSAVVTFSDITRLKETEENLRRSEATLRAVVTNAPSIIVTCTTEGRLLWMNRSPVEERSAEDWVGDSFYDYLSPKTAPMVRECMERVVSTKQPGGFELTVDLDGRPSTYSIRIGPVMSGTEVTALSVISTEVTELKALQSRVMISDRLASIGTLAAGVAHEINNPLTSITLSLERLDSQLEEPVTHVDLSAVRGGLHTALEGVRRVARIVRDLGSFSRFPDEKIEPVVLAEVISLAIQLSEHETRFRAEVLCDCASDLRVLADKSRLGQVFLNLLINAAQAIDEGNVSENQIAIAGRRAGESIVVTVSDTGKGIPSDLLNHVFEPFVTNKELGEGTGLGLHVCHKIVDSLGGDLEIQSRADEGTVVTVRLPATGALPEHLQTAKHAARTQGPPLRVLVVDDEEPVCATLVSVLSHHQVTTASNGRKALELLENNEYDLVFCDLIMPDLTGMDIFEHLRKMNQDALSRLVFMSGGGFTSRARTFLQTVTQPVLEKPFSIEDIEQHVAETQQRVELHNPAARRRK